MGNRPSVPEIITVNSEELQTLIRDLLPSQNGFGSELQASNVIFPIIDLTATAEGSTLRADLQSSLAFGSQTSTRVTNTTSTLVNSPGFYRVFGTLSCIGGTTDAPEGSINVTDGVTIKILFKVEGQVTGDKQQGTYNAFDFVVWLSAGESITATCDSKAICHVTTRQIANSAGAFVQPSGFPL